MRKADKLDDIGRRLQLARVKAGLTLRQAEQEADVSKDTISRVERGTRTPHPLTVAKLAAAYDQPIEELLGEGYDDLKARALPTQLSLEEAAEAGQVSEEVGTLLLVKEIAGPERPSLEDFTEPQLMQAHARFNAVRRQLQAVESEELRRHGGALLDKLINQIVLELNRRRGSYREVPGARPHPRYPGRQVGSDEAANAG